MEELGSKLKARRLELGWSQIELSKRTGLTQATISEIESGANFEIVTLFILLKVLNGSVIFQWKEPQ